MYPTTSNEGHHVAVMGRVVLHDVLYNEVPAGKTCDGCAGQDDAFSVCRELPHGCSTRNTIWVRDPGVPAKAYKPAHGGYPGEVHANH